MKIAYLLGSLNRGGTETLMLDVFRNSEINDLDAIGVYRKSGVLESEFATSGVKMFFEPVKNLFVYVFRLRSLLLTNQIAIAHAQQPLDALFASLACLFTNIKVVLTLHGYDFAETRFSEIMLKIVLKITCVNVYVSDSQRNYYTQKYKLKPGKQHTVYNGISFDKLKVDKTSKIRQELNIDKEACLIGSVGNFVPGRDQLTICKFLSELHIAKNEFHFLFIGKRNEQTPERYDECVDYILNHNLSNKVHFLGTRHDVPELLHQLNAFIYSTEHDTFGIAVVEALACGLPVFVNDWEVMTEITENNKLATIYKTKDEKDLFHQFSLFLQENETYITKALNASIKVKLKYGIEKHISNLNIIYSNVNS
jgi:glycosyltransferase involved in cell wall biosynthesis